MKVTVTYTSMCSKTQTKLILPDLPLNWIPKIPPPSPHLKSYVTEWHSEKKKQHYSSAAMQMDCFCKFCNI